jgi:hypothetical protein
MDAMRVARASLAQETVLADHVSEDGPTVTHVRGILLANGLQNLRQFGLYDTYCRLIPANHLEALQELVATTWLPVEHALAHYETCDRLSITAAQYAEIGSRQADRVRDTFLGVTLRRARNMGLDGLKYSLSQVGRLHDRIYRGGGCAAFDVGPKDVIFEVSGFPFATTHSFRSGWLAYAQSMSALFARTSYVKSARPRVLHPQRLALVLTWV